MNKICVRSEQGIDACVYDLGLKMYNRQVSKLSLLAFESKCRNFLAVSFNWQIASSISSFVLI